MTAAVEWEQLNNEYLADGLAWLREVLEGHRELAGWWTDERYAEAAYPPALEILAARFQMSRFEALLLLMCIAPELDPTIPRLYASAGADGGAANFALALSVLPEPMWDVVSPHRPLRYWRLIRVVQTGERPLTSCHLQADERAVNYVKGLNELDQHLAESLRLVPNPWGKDLVPSHEEVVATVLRAWDDPAIDDRLPVVELIGPDPRVRDALAAAAAGRAGLDLYRLPGPWLHSAGQNVAELVRLLDRESRLLPVAYYIDVSDLAHEHEAAVDTLCAELDAPLILGGHEPRVQIQRRTRVVDARRPTVTEQKDLWTDVLGRGNAKLAARLSDNFDLDPTTIWDCASEQRPANDGGAETPTAPKRLSPVDGLRLWDACRNQTRPRLATLAKRIDPVMTWDDLVLAGPELEALHQLADQIRGRPEALRQWGQLDRTGRGGGIAALFAGQSGTGKTLAAEVLANELRLTLYRIDLSGVVSKYIGETERNLRQVFDAAEQGGALLFFDEADALFGKRSEVRDSHDRYANIEVNYLLQRIEDYRGIAVLATNQRRSLDAAFMRRLRVVINFGFPSTAERRTLWQRALPADALTQPLDLGRLAELPATGGMIKNIALNAACCAAGQGGAVDMALIFAMARMEFKKLGLPLPDLQAAEELSA